MTYEHSKDTQECSTYTKHFLPWTENIHKIDIYLFICLFYWSLTLYSSIFHLDHGDQLYGGRKPRSIRWKPTTIRKLMQKLHTYDQRYSQYELTKWRGKREI